MTILADALTALIFTPMGIYIGALLLAAVREIRGWRS